MNPSKLVHSGGILGGQPETSEGFRGTWPGFENSYQGQFSSTWTKKLRNPIENTILERVLGNWPAW